MSKDITKEEIDNSELRVVKILVALEGEEDGKSLIVLEGTTGTIIDAHSDGVMIEFIPEEDGTRSIISYADWGDFEFTD